MKQIILKENSLLKIKNILTEGVETKNMRLAKHYLYDNFGYNEAQAMDAIGKIKTDIPNVRLAKCKFILGVTRMFFQKQLTDAEKILGINKTLKYIASDAHINEYNNDLNGESADTLMQRFSGIAKQDMEQEKELLSQKQYTQSDYQIVRIPDFDTSSQYGDYTTWCVTQDEEMYNSYTHGGLGLFYFCLKNGFENVEEIQGENCPLDEYGLSMIAVSVNNDGSPNTITCRWNHANGGNDNIMTPEQLSEIIGYNFYEVFKPYSEEEMAAKIKVAVQDIYENVEEEIYNRDYSNVVIIEDIEVPDYIEDDDGYEMYIENEEEYKYENSRFVLYKANDDVCDKYGWNEDYRNMRKFIIIDTYNNNTIIDKIFDDVYYYGMGLFQVEEGKKSYVINSNGENVLGDTFGYVNLRIIDEENIYAIVLKDNKYHNIINLQNQKPLFDWDNDLFNIKWFNFKPIGVSYQSLEMIQTVHSDGTMCIYKIFNNNLQQMLPSHKYTLMKVFNNMLFCTTQEKDMGNWKEGGGITVYLQAKDYTFKQFTKDDIVTKLKGGYGITIRSQNNGVMNGKHIWTYGVSINNSWSSEPDYYLSSNDETIYKKDENGEYIETDEISV